MLRALIVLMILCGCVPAQAARIAVDLTTGSVLVEGKADEPRYPSSLVKLMTAYVAFEALERGKIDEDDEIEVSAEVAKTPPVKLGLKKGGNITFGEALEAALIGSKNDAAVAVAEAVAGSESDFVELMNAVARKLGMASTKFVNATGLPATGQVTTARDMALLARALLRDHPDRSGLFSKRATKVGKRSVTTTNPLFGRVKGAKGLKTGFTCAGGYSIAALIERGERRVVAVTLGHESKAIRLRAIRALVDVAFEAKADGQPLVPRSQSVEGPPNVRACAGKSVPMVATDIPPEEMALFRAALKVAREKMAAKRWIDEPPPRKPIRAAAHTTAEPGAGTASLSGWGVFLGAHASESEANSVMSEVREAAKLSQRSHASLEGRKRDGRVLSVLHGLDRRSAAKACRAARKLSHYCLTLAPAKLVNRRARWRR